MINIFKKCEWIGCRSKGIKEIRYKDNTVAGRYCLYHHKEVLRNLGNKQGWFIKSRKMKIAQLKKELKDIFILIKKEMKKMAEEGLL